MDPVDLVPRVLAALDAVRPYIQGHGGDVRFRGLKDGIVEIEFLGACKGCPLTEVTLRLRVERALQERVPEVKVVEVQDG